MMNDCDIPIDFDTNNNAGFGGAVVPGTVEAKAECSNAKYVKNRAFGGYAGLSFDVTDTTSFNVQWGIVKPSDRAQNVGVNYSSVQTVHANIIWQPVRQMRLGLEGIYGRKRLRNNYLKGYSFGNEDYGDLTGPDPDAITEPVNSSVGATDPLAIAGGGACTEGTTTYRSNSVCRKRTEDAFRMQFGAWFFF
ncbi:MAG: hypothetical protein ACR2OR_08130 [Hyphomicrobiales bacterium]